MKLLALFAFFLLLIGWFYWFQYRPSKIRSYCDRAAREKTDWRVTKFYDADYDACLHEKGIK